VIVGSVQRQEARLRINVQLIEASAERALWGERYDGPMSDIFDLQDRLAAAVIAALEVELAPSERASLAKRPTANVIAYDHYLRGFEEHGRRSETQNLSARAHFQTAIELDPAFARAYAGLALTYTREAMDGWTSTPWRSLDLAAELAETAAVMDPSLAQVHFVTGQVDLFRHRYVQAVEAAERAITADKNYADAHALLAWILNYAGRPGEALSALESAMRLSTRPPASSMTPNTKFYSNSTAMLGPLRIWNWTNAWQRSRPSTGRNRSSFIFFGTTQRMAGSDTRCSAR